MRNARAEAAAMVDGHGDVRVLEPSPPAVHEAPWFADDPVAGGDVLPFARPGARTWADVCAEAGDPSLEAFCASRWLIRRPLAPLPDGFAATRVSLHAVAEHVVAPARHAANGKIGLRYTFGGYGTPYFGDERQVRVEGAELIDGEHLHAVTTLAELAAFTGVAGGVGTGVYTPTTAWDPDRPLEVDPAAAFAVGDWFGFCASVLEELRDGSAEAEAPSRVQLWPEHFDLAVDLGADGHRANYGGSPGDDEHPEPYLYVGPWDRSGLGSDPFWNEPFGASLSYSALLAGADPLAFLRRGKELVS